MVTIAAVAIKVKARADASAAAAKAAATLATSASNRLMASVETLPQHHWRLCHHRNFQNDRLFAPFAPFAPFADVRIAGMPGIMQLGRCAFSSQWRGPSGHSNISIT